MPKKKKRPGGKDRRVHSITRETGRPLCGAASGKVTSRYQDVTCDACGAAALRLVEADLDERLSRQEDALAPNQPSRWWEPVAGTDGPELT